MFSQLFHRTSTFNAVAQGKKIELINSQYFLNEFVYNYMHENCFAIIETVFYES